MSSKIKPFEELTFADDFMFNKVMHDPEICAEVIERLLHIKVDHIVYPEIQKSLQPYNSTQSLRRASLYSSATMTRLAQNFPNTLL